MFRRIAVHLDNGVDCRRRIDIALRMAKAHDAHLTGIFASHMQPGYFYDEGGLWARSMEIIKEINTKGRAATQQAFSQAAAQAGVAISWRQGDDTPADCLARHARYSDVVIVSQENGYDIEAATGDDFVPQTLLAAGRPVIVLPTAGTFETIGIRALYCWNRGREAARALADAAPMLRSAVALRVLTLQGAEEDPERQAAYEDLAAYCASHGFPPLESETRDAREAGIGDAILDAAADFGADLIVMGAYGHSRARQWILGGATRSLLSAMTVPVLFSH
ncbi:universal stress protein [Achromobacter ruhlandii]|uniref:universal stress protein n=1 Tax=Achromobacter ruhlandii TaxID=72557 RepID=UPI0006650B3B|nr:universal stress protein [Achromobacter ruhlandii]AKP90541.1 Universal stress protein family, tandem domain [Achromobacter xylosoxidans]AOU93780.1 universal stress family protein [Achromobacter ruhlandii]MCZ8432911.1 universal stress protein [Achromobacter ruhlandii]MDC6089897.1 universal stress protein [Achromobacter ruhlandii]MDC6152065.1 universal stress protein [Achromobacter ruhlandii]